MTSLLNTTAPYTDAQENWSGITMPLWNVMRARSFKFSCLFAAFAIICALMVQRSTFTGKMSESSDIEVNRDTLRGLRGNIPTQEALNTQQRKVILGAMIKGVKAMNAPTTTQPFSATAVFQAAQVYTTARYEREDPNGDAVEKAVRRHLESDKKKEMKRMTDPQLQTLIAGLAQSDIRGIAQDWAYEIYIKRCRKEIDECSRQRSKQSKAVKSSDECKREHPVCSCYLIIGLDEVKKNPTVCDHLKPQSRT